MKANQSMNSIMENVVLNTGARFVKVRLLKRKRDENYFHHYCLTKKSECKRKGFDFNLTSEYLKTIWTGICPIFGVEISKAAEGMGSHRSAHLDRLDPDKGYLIGNVAWISGRANRIKYNASIEELRAIADWMESATTISEESTSQANGDGSAQPAKVVMI